MHRSEQVFCVSASNNLAVILAGLLFFLFGAAVVGHTVYSVGKAVQVAEWESREARLLSVDVQSGESGPVLSDISYEYSVGAQRYESSRSHFYGGLADSQAYVLRGKQERGVPVECYVDPDDPSESVLFREIRPWYCAMSFSFGSVFVAIGLLPLIGLLGLSANDRARTLADQRPGEPWEWLPEWRNGVVTEGRPPTTAALCLVFLIGALGFAAGLVAAVFADAGDASPHPYYAGLDLCLVGFAIALWKWVGGKLGVPNVLVLPEVPVQRGRALRATVRLNDRTFDNGAPLIAELLCCRATPTLTGHSVIEVFWKAESEIESSDRSHDEVDVELEVSSDAPTFDRSEDTLWWLDLRRRDEQYGRRVRFLLPVFDTQES